MPTVGAIFSNADLNVSIERIVDDGEYSEAVSQNTILDFICSRDRLPFRSEEKCILTPRSLYMPSLNDAIHMDVSMCKYKGNLQYFF